VATDARRLSERRTAGQAAKFPGVSAPIPGNRDRTEALEAAGNPITGYRLDLRRDLERILRKAGDHPTSRK